MSIGSCAYVNAEIVNFYFTNWNTNIIPLYSSNNLISAYGGAIGEWFEIKIDTATINYSQSLSVNNPNGIFYNDVVQISIPKAENQKWKELTDILAGKYILVFKDANGNCWTLGYRHGAEVKSYKLEENQYILEFQDNHGVNLTTAIDCAWVITNIINTPTPTPSPSPSKSPMPSMTATPSATPSMTATPTQTPTPSQTPSGTPSQTPTQTPSVTATQTPTPTATPSVTPSTSMLPIYIGFEADGTIDFSAIGTDTISIQVRGSARAYQSWINCDFPPTGTSEFTWDLNSQQIASSASESSATSSNQNPSTINSDTHTFTNITSAMVPVVFADMNNETTYCGDGWGTVYLEILSITTTSGTGFYAPDPTTGTLLISTPIVSPTPTPTVTPTPSVTPSTTPPAVPRLDVYNQSGTVGISSYITVGGQNVTDSISYPVYPSDTYTNIASPQSAGTYSIAVPITNYTSGGCRITIVDSNSVSRCANVDSDTTYTISDVAMDTSTHTTITIEDTVCPSPTPSVTATPTVTPTPSATPGTSPTPSASYVDQVSLSPTSLSYTSTGTAKTQNYTTVTSNGSWSSQVINDNDSMINTVTASGGNGDPCTVTVYNAEANATSTALIRITRGTATADLNICRDGLVDECT